MTANRQVTTKAAAKGKAAAEELDAFARHMSEVLRIARTSDFFTSRFYNGLADAWNDFLNEMPALGEFQESEEYIRLALRADGCQRAEKGGGAK